MRVLVLLGSVASAVLVVCIAVGSGAIGSPSAPPSASGAVRGLPTGYAIPPDATAVEATVVSFALEQLDKPYVFDAAGPDAFDCSGLTMAAWHQVGVELAHSTTEQARAGTASTLAALRPADLILVPGDGGTVAAPDHVGLYLGDGLVINAADARDGIRVQSVADFVRVGGGLSAVRHIR